MPSCEGVQQYSMLDINQSACVLDNETLHRFQYLLSEVVKLVIDMGTFRLLLLVLLTNGLVTQDGRDLQNQERKAKRFYIFYAVLIK
jgi:hypothetical protein